VDERRKVSAAAEATINKGIKNTQERLDANSRQAELVEEAMGFSQQLHRDQCMLIDDLSYYLNSSSVANRLLLEATDANECDYRSAMTFLDEAQSDLLLEKRALRVKEEELYNERARLARDATGR